MAGTSAGAKKGWLTRKGGFSVERLRHAGRIRSVSVSQEMFQHGWNIGGKFRKVGSIKRGVKGGFILRVGKTTWTSRKARPAFAKLRSVAGKLR